MTYWFLNIGFFAIVAIVALAAIVFGRAPRWRIVGLAAIPLLLLTVIFDNVLVGAGIVAYDPGRISGAYLGFAPVEDFSYAVAAVVLLPCLWTLLAPNSRHADRSSARSVSNARVRNTTPREPAAELGNGPTAELRNGRSAEPTAEPGRGPTP